MAAPLELYYFPLYAKGLGPALVAEFSGLAWKGPAETGWDSSQWRAEGGLKASGASPFGQLPLLKTGGPAGNIGQTVAIVNFIGKTAGPALEGTDEREYAVSQMLICEAEDLYSLLQKDNPTIYAPLSTAEKPSRKGDLAAYGTLWATTIPGHLEKLEALCTAEGGFTKTGATAGELLLFDYRLRHRGLANITAAPRPVAYFVFTSPGLSDTRNFPRESVYFVLDGATG